MLAQDPNICVVGSNVRKRMERYAELFDELHVVVMTASFKARKPQSLFCFGETPRSPDEHSVSKRKKAIGVFCGHFFLYPAAGNPLLRRWRIYTTARTLARRVHFDVVSAQAPDEVGFIAYRIARRFGIKLQLQVHTDMLSPWYWRASWKEYLRALLAGFLLPRADCVRAVSRRIKRSLIAELHIPESRIFVLPIFTDREPFSARGGQAPRSEDLARLKEYVFRMIAVGRFVDKEKNFSMLIKMMLEFIKQEPAAVLVLVGDGPDKENYKLQITNYKLEKNVIIEPWRNDLPSFYQCFDALLISSNYEGWSLVAIEAMAAGLPLVMTDVGLAGEVVHDNANGRVVPVGDTDAFLDAVLDLYRHSEKRCAFADAGRRAVAEIKPQSETEYLKLYRKNFEGCVT